MSAPLNFPDVVFFNDLDIYAREITSDYQGLRQDIHHLEMQALGSNLDDITKGLDVDARLSGTAAEIMALPGEADEQLAQDDRVASSQSTVVQNLDGSYTFTMVVQPSASVLPADGSVAFGSPQTGTP